MRKNLLKITGIVAFILLFMFYSYVFAGTVTSLSPTTVPNCGTVYMDIYGSGFVAECITAYCGPSLNGVIWAGYSVVDDTHMRAFFEFPSEIPNIVQPGVYDFVMYFPTGRVILPSAVTVIQCPDTIPPNISNLTPPPNSAINTSTPSISAIVYDTEPDATGVNPATIVMKLDGNLVVHSYDSLTGLVSYVPSPLSLGLHSVYLEVKDKAENLATASWTFTIDTTPPTITNLQPPDGSTVNTSTPTISAIVADGPADSGINPSTIQLTLDGNVVSHSYDSGTGLVSYTPEPLADGLHSVTLNVSDNAGNPATASWSFTVDTTPPTITNLTPPDGSTVDTPTPTISAIVSDEVGESGVNPSSIQIILDSSIVSHSYNPFTGLVSYTPEPLADGLHSVTLNVSDNAGNPAAAGWSFTVEVPEVPEITDVHFSNNSRSGATDIAIGEEFKVTAVATPGLTELAGAIANADYIPEESCVIGFFHLSEVSPGNYEYVATLTTVTDAAGREAVRLASAAFIPEVVGPVIAPERLTVKVAPPQEITEAHLYNVTRPDATDIAIGEQYKIVAKGTPNQTNVLGVVANADRVPPQPGENPMIGTPFILSETSPGSGIYEATQTLTSVLDVDGFTATKLLAAVSNTDFTTSPVVTPEILTVTTVLPPAEALKIEIQKMEDLKEEISASGIVIAQGLNAKLDASIGSINRAILDIAEGRYSQAPNMINGAQNQLQAFVNMLSAQSGKKVSQELAQKWLAEAQGIIAELEKIKAQLGVSSPASKEKVSAKADLNADGKINEADLEVLKKAFNSKPGDKNWNPECDLNGDGKIDLGDFGGLVKEYNK